MEHGKSHLLDSVAYVFLSTDYLSMLLCFIGCIWKDSSGMLPLPHIKISDPMTPRYCNRVGFLGGNWKPAGCRIKPQSYLKMQ